MVWWVKQWLTIVMAICLLLTGNLAIASGCQIPKPFVSVQGNKPLGQELISIVNGLSGRGESISVINFWVVWCTPCRKELPMLARLINSLEERVQVQAVNVGDSQSVIQQVLTEMDVLHLGTAQVDSFSPLRGLGIHGLPVTLVMQGSGAYSCTVVLFCPG